MRKTKIICTLGPASNDEKTIRELMLAGMNVVRLNFSHGTYEEHQHIIDKVKKVRKELDLPVAIMLDTKGPEYRIGTFENRRITLSSGDKFTFTTKKIIGNQQMVSVSYSELANELSVGDSILVNDGLVSFSVEEINDNDIICKVIEGGEISDRKSMSFPNKVLNSIFLSEQDKQDILFGLKNDIDYIAASFVSNRENILDIKCFLEENNGNDVGIVAKIENQSGVDNIEEICDECEGIMVARGDLGVEIPFKLLPSVQKKIITFCRLRGKRVITATEMLESMIQNARPTRAEISDVANAVYDGTSAVMLSGETASGKYPVKTVQVMSAICEETEKNINYRKLFHDSQFIIRNNIDAVSHSACNMALMVDAKAISVCSISGRTVRMVSRFRPVADIIGLTTNEKIWRKLSLSWGVIPVLTDTYPSSEVMFFTAMKKTKKTLGLENGDNIIVIGGATSGVSGETNTIRLDKIY